MYNIGTRERTELLSNAFVHAQLNTFANDDSYVNSVSNDDTVVDSFSNDDAILDGDVHGHFHNVNDGNINAKSHTHAYAVTDVVDNIYAHSESNVHAVPNCNDTALLMSLADAPPLRD